MELPDQVIKVVVKDQGGKVLRFGVHPNAPLSKLMEAYCKHKDLDVRTLRFLYNGERITKKQTAAKMGMKDGDEVLAWMTQTGGGFPTEIA